MSPAFLHTIAFRCYRALFCSILLVFSHHVYSQSTNSVLDEKLSLRLKNNTCLEALELIKSKLELRFTFNNQLLPEKRMTKRFRKTPLKSILKYLFSSSDLVAVAHGNRVIIRQGDIKELPPKPQFSPKLKYTFNGYLKDQKTGEELVGGTVAILPNGTGEFTNEYGFFSLTLPEANYLFQFDYIGYESVQISVDLKKNQRIDIELSPIENQLVEVVVTDSEFSKENPTKNSEHIDVSQTNDLPSLFGEPDVMRNLTLLPGIFQSGTASTGISVRGGNADHNLILLDEAPIYHSSHTLGLFSIFNPDAIKNIRLLKGRIPAEFRGRLSSVVDIRMKEGNNKKFGGAGGIGFLAARLQLEGRLNAGKGSFMIAGRRTYPDLILKAVSQDFSGRDGIFFHDVNLKFNYKLGEKDRIFLSSYTGRDVFRAGETFSVVWGNNTVTARWNHLYSEKLFSNISFIYNDFSFKSSTDAGDLVNITTNTDLQIETTIRDLQLKTNFHYYLSPKLDIRFGLSAIEHNFVPGKIFDNEIGSVVSKTPSKKAVETGLFLSGHWEPNQNWSINFGLHNSGLLVLGDDDWINQYDDEGLLVDSTYYQSGELITQYFGLEPRLSIIRQLKNNAELSFSYDHTIQYLQIISSISVNNPAAVWLPSSNNIKPQRAHQVNVGYHQNLFDKQLRLSLEGYYIYRNRQITFRNNRDFTVDEDLEANLTFGESYTTGVEFFAKLSRGRLKGWFSYAYAISRDQFRLINNGRRFKSTNDRPHNLSLVLTFEASPKMRLSATYTYLSGRILTVPAGKYVIDNTVVSYFGKRNNFRMGDNKRLDLSILWHKTGKKGMQHEWNLSIHNALFNRNPQFLYIDPQEGEATEITLLGFLPSFGYSFKF